MGYPHVRSLQTCRLLLLGFAISVPMMVEH